MTILKKVGILGAGQLGKMLAQSAADWSLEIHGMDPDANAPAAHIYHSFKQGDYNDYDTVISFGKEMDLITIEIEHVNTQALIDLEKQGIKVHPSPTSLEIIKDKGAQKLFYDKIAIPTAPFQLVNNRAEIIDLILSGNMQLPLVQKSRLAGYDGKGVKILYTREDLEDAMDVPSVIEQKADIVSELAVIVSKNESNELACFPVVEMLFNEKVNLVENLICPASISTETAETCTQLAKKIIVALNLCGVLAVEFFLNKNGEIWVNEVAPRPHNSGHHTIEACFTSQYQQHLRSILNFSPGNTDLRTPFAMMINLLGEEGYSGSPQYTHLDQVLKIPDTYVHLYGKKSTKPFRKMGHVTLLGEDKESLFAKSEQVGKLLKVIA
jgi:5-(carboxyamino)imidazole ribonucleotide synthase